MKQSTVEWFNNELKELIKQSELTEMKPSEFDDREAKLLEQAKEMENEQGYSEEDLKLAWKDGRDGTSVVGSFPLTNTRFTHCSFNDWFEQFKNK